MLPAVTLLTTTLTAKSIKQVFDVALVVTRTLSAIPAGINIVPSGASASGDPLILKS